MGSKKGMAIRAAAKELNLDEYGEVRKSMDVQRSIEYGDNAAKCYMERMRKQEAAGSRVC